MKISHMIGIGAVTLAAATAFAVAPDMTAKVKADADGNGIVSKTEAVAAADARFAKMDANGDGKISVEDRSAMTKKHFTDMDTDKNGSISETEFNAAHAERMAMRDGMRDGMGDHHKGGRHHGGRDGRPGHGGQDGMGGGAMGLMQNADKDGDKAVTRAEFRAAAEARFATADANKDGSLSATERQAQRDKWRADRPAAAPVPATKAEAAPAT